MRELTGDVCGHRGAMDTCIIHLRENDKFHMKCVFHKHICAQYKTMS